MVMVRGSGSAKISPEESDGNDTTINSNSNSSSSNSIPTPSSDGGKPHSNRALQSKFPDEDKNSKTSKTALKYQHQDKPEIPEPDIDDEGPVLVQHVATFQQYVKMQSARRVKLMSMWEILQLLVLSWNLTLVPFQLAFAMDDGLMRTGPIPVVLCIVFDATAFLDTWARILPLLMGWALDFKLYIENVRSSRKMRASKPLPRSRRASTDLRITAQQLFGIEATSGEGDEATPNLKWGLVLENRPITVLVDIISSFPFDWIAVSSGSSGAMRWRLLRVLALWRLGHILWRIGGWLEHTHVIVNAGFKRMIVLWYVFSVLAHWVGCGFFYLGKINAAMELSSWAISDGLVMSRQQAAMYMQSGPQLNDTLAISIAAWSSAIMETSIAAAARVSTVAPTTILEASNASTVILTGLGGMNFTESEFMEDYYAEALAPNTWNFTGPHAPVLLTPSFHAYMRSVYWSCVTMVTVGLGDIVPAAGSMSETLYSVLSMYLGVILTCIVVGNLTNLVANLDALEDEFYHKMDNLNRYLSYRNISGELQQRIHAYYNYMWTSLKGVDEERFLRDLPATLRFKVVGQRSRDLVSQISFLRNANDTLINAICFSLEQVVVSPGDKVVVAGSVSVGVFFLSRGDAETLSATGSVSANLSGKFGSIFGENSLFFKGTLQPNTVRARSYCEFFFLNREKFIRDVEAHASEAEQQKMYSQAEKSAKREEKVKKFFGLDAADVVVETRWAKAMLPTSSFRAWWRILDTCGLLYNTFIIPLRLAHYPLDPLYVLSASTGMYALDWLFDVIVIIDIILQMRFFAYLVDGVVVRSPHLIFTNYKSKRASYMDIFSALPIDVLAVADFNILPFLRLSKVLRMMHFGACYTNWAHLVAAGGLTLSNAFHRLIKISCLVLITVHWIGCMWLFLAYLGAYMNEELCETMGLQTMQEQCGKCRDDWLCFDATATWKFLDHSDGAVSYLRAVYFVLVDMTTVGYGDIVPINTVETAFAMMITLFGGFLYPAVVGAMAALISNLNSAKADFRHKVTTLSRYMDKNKFPDDLKVRVLRYYDYLWSRQRGVDEEEILNDLPPPLRSDVQGAINGNIVTNIHFLEGAEPEFLKNLMSMLKPAVFLPNDIIIRAGEFGQEMYMLERGAIRVTSPDGATIYAVLTRGDYFGEGCMLKTETRTATIRAISYCDCFVLHRATFQKLINEYPDSKAMVMGKLRLTMKKKKKENAQVLSNFEKYHKLQSITSHDNKIAEEVGITSIRHPDSAKRMYWNVLIFFCIIFNAIVIPLRISFIQHDTNTDIFGYMVDVIVIVDVVLRSRYFGFVKEGIVYADKLDVAEHYAHRPGRRIIDGISVFPFEIVALFAYAAGVRNLGLELALLRLPKLIRLFELAALLQSLDKLIETRLRLPEVIVKLVKLAFGVMIVSHYTACGFYLIALFTQGDDTAGHHEACTMLEAGASAFEIEQVTGISTSNNSVVETYEDKCPAFSLFTDDVPFEVKSCAATLQVLCEFEKTWVHLQLKLGLLPVTGGTVSEKYLRAMNWAIPTLVVVVIGDVIPVNQWDTLYVTLGIIVGVTINAAIIGSIANLVANLEGLEAVFRSKSDALENFLHVHSMPQFLRERARNFYLYIWETQSGYNQDSIIEDLPSTLRHEVSCVLKLNFVESCPFFGFCDLALAKSVAYSLHKVVYSPDDIILHEGDMGHTMYFIECGLVQMMLFHANWRKAASSSNGVSRRTQAGGVSRRRLRHRVSTVKRNSLLTLSRYTVLATQGAGTFFGETGMFFGSRRSCSVQALDYCELFVLTKSDLDEVLLRYPFERDRMFNEVIQIQEQNMRRSATIRKQIQGATTHDIAKLGKLLALNEFDEIMDLHSNIRGQKKVHMFHPRSMVAQLWNVTKIILIGWLTASIPYRAAFAVPGRGAFIPISYIPHESLWPLLLEFYLIEAFFILDMYMHHQRFAQSVGGTLQNSAAKVSKEYIRTWFRLDLFSTLPFELLALMNFPNASFVTKLSWVRLPHLMRLAHMPSLLVKLEGYFSEWGVRVGSAWMQVIKVFLAFVTINHIYGCIWFSIHRFIETNEHRTWAIVDGLATFNSTIGQHNTINDNVSPIFCYLRAFYFAITTLSTVGYGDIRPYNPLETIFQTLVVLTGACLFAGIIGSVAVAFHHSDSNGQVAFMATMRKLQDYMEYRELPKELQDQISHYFSSMYEYRKGVNFRAILEGLPTPMQLDIAYATHGKTLVKIPLVKPCNRFVVKHLCLAMRPLLATKGEHVYNIGDIGHEIYFIVSGKISIYTEDRKLKNSLKTQSMFGESNFHSLSGERKETVVAESNTSMVIFRKDDLEKILVDFPMHRNVGFFARIYGGKQDVASVHSNSVLETFASRFENKDWGKSKQNNSSTNLKKQHWNGDDMDALHECDSDSDNVDNLEDEIRALKRSRSFSYLMGAISSLSSEFEFQCLHDEINDLDQIVGDGGTTAEADKVRSRYETDDDDDVIKAKKKEPSARDLSIAERRLTVDHHRVLMHTASEMIVTHPSGSMKQAAEATAKVYEADHPHYHQLSNSGLRKGKSRVNEAARQVALDIVRMGNRPILQTISRTPGMRQQSVQVLPDNALERELNRKTLLPESMNHYTAMRMSGSNLPGKEMRVGNKVALDESDTEDNFD